MSEQQIAVGQTWASNDGRRTIRVEGYNAKWDDCNVRNLATRRLFAIYGSYLRSRYTLTDPARAVCRDESTTTAEEATNG